MLDVTVYRMLLKGVDSTPEKPVGNQTQETLASKVVELEKKLMDMERMYHILADNMTDTIWLLDLDLRTTYISPSAHKVRGYTPDELIGLPIEKQVKPESLQLILATISEDMARIQENSDINPVRKLEIELYRKDGSTFWSENTFSLIKDEKGIPMGVLSVGHDITERISNEQKLQRSYERLQKAMTGALQTIAMISEVRDPYTSGHQQQVSKLAAAIGREMGLSEKQVAAIQMAGALHDIGKINIPAEILSKPGSLNKIEFDLIKTHPSVGREILKSIDFPFPICQIIVQHHERINGSGYPEGLTADDICLEAKILAVADVVDAMSFHRPYRPARGIEEALNEISQNRGVLYDADVVDACIRLFRQKGFILH